MEESHAKLRDRPCLEDRPSAARGLYLQGSACCSEARVLFKCFPFGECGNPATLVVWRFQRKIPYSEFECITDMNKYMKEEFCNGQDRNCFLKKLTVILNQMAARKQGDATTV